MVLIVAGVIVGIRSGTAVWVYNLASVANLVLGLLIWSRRPDHRLGPLVPLIGLLGPVSGLSTIGGFGTIESNISANSWRSTVGAPIGTSLTGLIVLSLIWFPTGKLPSSR